MTGLRLPDLPADYRWRIEKGDGPREWLVTLEQRTGRRWWRDGWRKHHTRRALPYVSKLWPTPAEKIEYTARRMARELDHAHVTQPLEDR